MARLMERDLRPLQRLEGLFVGMRHELLQRPLHVFEGVERLRRGPGPPPVMIANPDLPRSSAVRTAAS